jgi:U4/U6 small nuclear ribonucleoprotein PRP31
MSSLLDDLNDLGEEEEEDSNVEEEEDIDISQPKKRRVAFQDDRDESTNIDGNNGGEDKDEEQDYNMDIRVIEEPRDKDLDAELEAMDRNNSSSSSSSSSSLPSIQRLRSTRRFIQHMKNIEAALSVPFTSIAIGGGTLEDSADYQLMVASNALIRAIDDEMIRVHKVVADTYKRKFPELSSVVPNSNDYIRLVHLIAGSKTTDLTSLDMSSILTPTQIMVVTVTGSTSSGINLSEEELSSVLKSCEEFVGLEAAKARILEFVASRMHAVAPNLSALLSPSVAARLVGAAGGLAALARVPGGNVATIGQKKQVSSTGLGSKASLQNGYGGTIAHAGVIYDSPICVAAPTLALKAKTAHVLGPKAVLAARVDAFNTQPTNSTGLLFLKQVEAQLVRWQIPPPPRAPKPLKAPDDKPSKKRGGRRARALKEKLGMTDVRRDANRVSFNGGGEYDESVMGIDRGMLGTGVGIEGGRMKTVEKAQKSLLNSKKRMQLTAASVGHSGLATAGTLSTFVFAPVQGIDLPNPQAQGGRSDGDQSGFFSSVATFSKK